MKTNKIIIFASLIISFVMIYVAINGLAFRPKKLIKPSLVKNYCEVGTLLARNLFAELVGKKSVIWLSDGSDSQFSDCFQRELINNKNAAYIIKTRDPDKSLLSEDRLIIQIINLNGNEAIEEKCFQDSVQAQSIDCLKGKKSLEIKHKSKGEKGDWLAAEQVSLNKFLVYIMPIQ